MLSPSQPAPTAQPGQPPFPRTPFAFTWWVVRQLPGRCATMLGLTIVGHGLQASAPFAVGGLIDVVNRADYEQIPLWFSLFVAALLGGPLLTRLYTFANAFTMPKMRVLVDRALFGHTLGQSTRFFNDNFAGAINQRIRRGGQSMPGLFESTLPFFRIGTFMTVGAVTLATVSASYALAFLAFAVVFVGVTVPMARHVVDLVGRTAKARSRVTGRIADTISNADVVRSFGAWEREQAQLEPVSLEEYHRARDVRIAMTGMRVVQLFLSVGFLAAISWVALQSVVAGTLSAGDIVTIFTVTLQLGLQISQLGDEALNMFEHVGDLKESLDALARDHDIPDRSDAQPLAVRGGGIRFEDVSFTYPDGRRVFERLNLDVRPGERVGLVGRSGAGKSTLVKLLTRRHLVTSGRVCIDGQDIQGVTQESIALAIGEVPQATEMFHRSIRENIRYGRPGAGNDAVEAASKAAGCHDFILARPGGYDAVVGEKGVKLSGGEKQRIAVARAFLKDAPILVLDEATSSLDTETELALQDALWRLMAGRTVIAIAHRLSTLRAMDRVVVMEDGEIIEQGPPSALIASSGAFARAWALQHPESPERLLRPVPNDERAA
ncbi:MAG: ABC transporter ATP-binding protein [Alphaproteobacteria bacterium]|nr:ABC transporter ATP-binding protein [Alphaproteobacteria bacterium]